MKSTHSSKHWNTNHHPHRSVWSDPSYDIPFIKYAIQHQTTNQPPPKKTAHLPCDFEESGFLKRQINPWHLSLNNITRNLGSKKFGRTFLSCQGGNFLMSWDLYIQPSRPPSPDRTHTWTDSRFVGGMGSKELQSRTRFNEVQQPTKPTIKNSQKVRRFEKNNNAKIHQHLTSKTETENFLSKKNNYKTSRWTYLLGFPKKPRQKASQSFQPTTLEILSIHGALSSPWCSSSTVTLSPSFASRSPSSWTSSWRHFPQFLQISELEGELSTMVDRISSVKGVLYHIWCFFHRWNSRTFWPTKNKKSHRTNQYAM